MIEWPQLGAQTSTVRAQTPPSFHFFLKPVASDCTGNESLAARRTFVYREFSLRGFSELFLGDDFKVTDEPRGLLAFIPGG
jgi:hypothetical protein